MLFFREFFIALSDQIYTKTHQLTASFFLKNFKYTPKRINRNMFSKQF